MKLLLFFLFLILNFIETIQTIVSYKRYECIDGVCVQQKLGSTSGVSLSVCNLNCHSNGSLWPVPTGKIKLGKSIVCINPPTIQLKYDSNDKKMKQMLQISLNDFKESVQSLKNKYQHQYSNSKDCSSIHLQISSSLSLQQQLTLDTDESYKFTITKKNSILNIRIIATTYFGVRHAFETLSQLIGYDERDHLFFMVSNVQIEDQPKFPYRGIMIDTSRNYYPIQHLKRLIQGLAYNKLNTLHWHVSDTSSFAIEFLRETNVTKYGAYSPNEIYTQKDIKELVEYSNLKGVRLLPELDAPSHTGAGWDWGPEAGKGSLAFCLGAKSWEKLCLEPPCGQLNPLNEETYKVLKNLYDEMIEMTSPDIFHMGGDEVSLPCWKSSIELHQLLKNQTTLDNSAYYALWGKFQQKAFQKLEEVSKKYNRSKPIDVMLWTSHLTNINELEKTYLRPHKNRYIIQNWDSSTTDHTDSLLKKGYRVVISYSDILYLDCGVRNWVGKGGFWCDPYKSWKDIYDLNPYIRLSNDAVKSKHLILGAEAPLWSEIADPATLDAKVWPRGAALAERLWSNPPRGWYEADNRMQWHRHRLYNRGLNPAALQPYWCVQNPGQCSINKTLS